MNIRISADSTCDLSPELIEKYDIRITPLYIVRDGQSLVDGKDITPDEIYAHVNSGGGMCSTAAVSVYDYTQFFRRQLEECDAVVHFHISGDMSACYQNACIAAQEVGNVYPVDSRSLSTGIGQLVLEAAQNGLNASVVLPSGLIGPGDLSCGNTTRMLLAFCRGRLPLGVKGGYDFVDVRDVAAGVLSCTERGKAGECYILSGHYASIQDIFTLTASLLGREPPKRYVPASLAKCAAPVFEIIARLRNERSFFTPYSIAVLCSNGNFSNRKAARELGFHARPLKETLRSTILWFQEQKLLSLTR